VVTFAEHAQRHALNQLARLYGVQTAYHDVCGVQHTASPDALRAVLRLMGAPLHTASEISDALRARRQALWQRGCEPVVVVWDGRASAVALRLPSSQQGPRVSCELALETGEQRRWTCDLDQLPASDAADIEGVAYVTRRLTLPAGLPPGYHRLTLDCGGSARFTSLIISAPTHAYALPEGAKLWGVFLPLYALRTQRSLGSGTLADFHALTKWVNGLGGSVVATLPMLAAFLDEPFEPSPYAPASRLFWNEFYLDVTGAPEFAACPAAQALLQSAPVASEVEALRQAPLVDYRREMALKRRLLMEMAAAARQQPAASPELEAYAKFRAVEQRQRRSWHVWPSLQKEGAILDGDYDPAVMRYHLYVQRLADQQLGALSQQARQCGPGLYLDLPLGVHADSFDVWRNRSLFALEASGGAPPDDFFTTGQDWGFPPLQPDAIRAEGYRYIIACLRHHLRHAGLLRIDHVMGVHRLFWIPREFGAADGVYVRYRAEELYAILTLESQRHRALIVGEDLGTVPDSVRPALARHRILRMAIGQFECTADAQMPIRPIPANAVVCVNTHDTPSFAAMWQDADVEERRRRGLLTDDQARRETDYRATIRAALVSYFRRQGWLGEGLPSLAQVLKAFLTHLAKSDAPVMLVSLEDLWGETQPQNIPGTWREHPNWRRKARYTFEQFSKDPKVLDLLHTIAQIRR